MYLQVVKKLWAYIRENNLQDPSNKRKILCDERLKKIFNVNSIDMFQMNKALTKHIWPLNSDGLFLFLSPAPPSLSLYTRARAQTQEENGHTLWSNLLQCNFQYTFLNKLPSSGPCLLHRDMCTNPNRKYIEPAVSC